MRYPADHKERVRERIIEAASRRFRDEGSEKVAIADLMRDLKLTHGGFYRHFKGKEHLFNEAFLAAAAETGVRMAEAARQAGPGRELEGIINSYLSERHAEHPGFGCPVAALSAEIAKHPKSTRAALDLAVRENAAALGRFMPGRTAADRQQAAMVLFSGMAGALTLARATADEELRRNVLSAARAFYTRAFSRQR